MRSAARLTVAIVLAHLAIAASAAATVITIVDRDAAGVGLNDSAPRAPVGGNAATTLGTQRLAAFQFAADIWAARLASPVEIRVGVTWTDQACDASSAILGNAGATAVFFNFAGAAPDTLYPSALADKVAGLDLDPGHDDIVAHFNNALGTSGTCGFDFYLGLDGNPPTGTSIDLVAVALHELGHGLGFAPVFNVQTGAELLGMPDVFELDLERHGVGLLSALGNAGRAAADVDDGNLHFVGPNVTAALGTLTAGVSHGHVRMYAPTTLQPGSSVSHFDVDLLPDQLMEPAYTGPNHDPGLALEALCDIGWGPCGICGDGVVDPNETCDDGNTDSGDGCSSECRVEACWSCNGAPSTCTQAADDTPCNDGSACTATDTCQGGVCTGTDPVTCTALDQCHDVGVCDPSTGACSNPAKPAGAACDDGNECTGPDTCTAGECLGLPSCIDPFLCAKAKTSKLGTPFVTPPPATLAGAFETSDVTLARPKGLCSPAELNAAALADAATHLESYPVKLVKGHPKHVKRIVLVTNALGTITMQTQKPAFVFAPTNVDHTADPPPTSPGIAVDHYECYAAKVASGTPKFPKGVVATVADDLLEAPETVAVKKPTHLCVPVDANGSGIAHASVVQLCYAVKPSAKHLPTAGIFVHPQFGAERLDAAKEDRLCVPSLATVL